MLWVLQTLNNYIELYSYPNEQKLLSENKLNWITRIAFGTLILGCIIMGIIRIIDPFFKQMIYI